MKDLGQEALDEMNCLLLNQKQLKMKLERMGNYGESATIKIQLADLSKKVERLQEQLEKKDKLIEKLKKDKKDCKRCAFNCFHQMQSGV